MNYYYYYFWLEVGRGFGRVTDVSEPSLFPLFETHYLTLFIQSLPVQLAT